VLHVAVFGGSGAIGSEIVAYFKARLWDVTIITRRSATDLIDAVCWNPIDEKMPRAIEVGKPFDAVCWAQGQNCNDSVYDFDSSLHIEMYQSNVLFILKSLTALLDKKMLAPAARLCVISSIWQNISRQNKLSYGISKAALQGLVLSAANDLGRDGYLINAVLPGALETPMTRKNLSTAQIDSLANATQFGRLPELEDVASAVFYLCSPQNTGITGQFIKVDLGYSDVRVI
jgi:3-oxoacyl-[acyl-carrier protein] reductase